MPNAYKDENGVSTLIASSTADGKTPVRVYANPSTHRLLVDLGSGVTGGGSSTDKAVVRWDGATGITIQNSVVLIGDTGAVTGVSTLVTTGAVTGGSSITATTFVNAASYKVGGVDGADGSFTTVDNKTVTVVKGIITSIV